MGQEMKHPHFSAMSFSMFGDHERIRVISPSSSVTHGDDPPREYGAGRPAFSLNFTSSLASRPLEVSASRLGGACHP